MICVPSYLATFVKKILANEDFLAFKDEKNNEWVCVFDFIDGNAYADFFKSIFAEFCIAPEKVQLKEADAMFHDKALTEKEHEQSIGRDLEIEDFAFRNASEIEKGALRGAYCKGVNSLYVLKKDFELAKKNVKEKFTDKPAEYVRLSFVVEDSLLVYGNMVCEINTMNKEKTRESWILEYFFSEDNYESEDWTLLYQELEGSLPRKGDVDRRRLRDAINAINEKSINAFGFSCLTLKGSEVRNNLY